MSQEKKSSAMVQRVEDLLNKLTLKEKVSLLAGMDRWSTTPIERLGIPSVITTDGPHGVRTEPMWEGRIHNPATSFPTGVSMASSWNIELIELVGVALAEETRALACDILLAPCVNIVRTPLAGRNFETYSEDPYLAGRIGVAYVQGVQSRNVGTSLKHYACNNQEFERMRGSSVVDERTLREIYLPAFEAIVKEALPWTVMCAYNRINGVYASEHHYLLTEILREEWGFEGVVISDWGANHTIVESVKGGLDIEMPGPARYYGDLLVHAVDHWQIDEAVIDESVRRILRMILRSGKMDDPAALPAALPAGAVNTPEHQALAREMAEESIVLLKNAGDVLPLKDVKRVAVIGPNAAEARIGGGGSSYLEPPYRVSPLEGLRLRLGDGVEIAYERGCDNFFDPPVLKPEYLIPSDGDGPGLLGTYFDNIDLSGQAGASRIDRTVEFWRLRPPTEIDADVFSVRWTGTLIVPDTGRHVFKLGGAGICRLYLDGELIVELIYDQPWGPARRVGEAVGYAELVGGRAYDIVIEYVKLAGVFPVIYVHSAYAPEPGKDDRLARAVELARRSDVAIVCAGMPTGYDSEGHDRPNMALPGPQAELIRAVAAANENTIVVLNCGAPVELPWIDDVPALVLAYYPGQEGGNAVANILTGDVNPSGKLSVTFPRRYEDNPTYINYPGGREVRYGEGIFVGYRYYDQKDVKPLFPFGFGLSYTTFEYSGLQIPETVQPGKPIDVSVTVTNTGARAGKEVVQLYVSDKESSLPRPPKELKGFKKVQLNPGESKMVDFVLDQRALSFYDPAQRQWVAEPGEFEVLVGSSSRDIRLSAVCILDEVPGSQSSDEGPSCSC
jgi:beta-glucosidase